MTGRKSGAWVFVAGALMVTMASAVGAQPASNAVDIPADAVTVLSETGFWRWHVTWLKPLVPLGALKAAGIDATEPRLVRLSDYRFRPRPELVADTPPPPENWIQPDFDDSAWPRTSGRYFPDLLFYSLHTGTVSLRGRFAVSDPSAVRGLYLSGTFRGGVVVYLNGREVARGGLPAGEIAATRQVLTRHRA